MKSPPGSVYEIMLTMRHVACSWTKGDREMADELVATALKRALEEIPGKDCVDIEAWLLLLLAEARDALADPTASR